MADQGGVHDEHPFRDPPELRDPVRRFRGRLAAPVTIVTAGSGSDRAGLTVASIVVAEGEPPLVYFLLSATTDLHGAIVASGGFVVHVVPEDGRVAADVFAGIRPSPGGVFSGLDVEDGPRGPMIGRFPNRAHCALVSLREESYSVLVAGAVEQIDVTDIDDPLVWFRGRYLTLDGPS